jgi:excisionase family DNA binding protein
MENGRSPQRPWFTAKEAAEYVGVHLWTLYSYTKKRKNKPPFIRLGGSGPYRFPRDQFIEWANGSRKQG